MAQNFYTPVRNRPVAKFFYKGQSHTHPVRRTVVIIESKPTYIRGYEIREGADAREFGPGPVKTYRKSKIATIGEIDKRRVLRKSEKDLTKSTLVRLNWTDLLRQGV